MKNIFEKIFFISFQVIDSVIISTVNHSTYYFAMRLVGDIKS